MPDSSITKQALALSLKELMQEMPFDMIRVSMICEKCSMNRQSFYYHFRDKYELMNWIFDVDYKEHNRQSRANGTPENMLVLCNVLYSNRSFYRSAFTVQGQNSLTEHLREITLPAMHLYLQEVLNTESDAAFYAELFLDTLFRAVIHWINTDECEPPEEFIAHFFSCVISTAKYILKKYPSS